VLYFSQLLALALGAPADAIGLQRGFVPIGPVFANKEIAYA
jgi:heterodisulfide reductase subunit B